MAIKQFLKGRNVVVLCPEKSTRTRLGKSVLRAFGKKYTTGSMIFSPYNKIIECNLVIVMLLQPQTLAYIGSAKQLERKGADV